MRPAQIIRRSSSLASDFSTTQPISTPPSSLANSPDSTPTTAERNTSSSLMRNPKLYKTELCRSWMDKGSCNYGERCQYAHGVEEKRPLERHPKYKTAYCQSFHNNGFCPYGPRCHFIHSEEPSRPDTPQSNANLTNGGADKRVLIGPTISVPLGSQRLQGNYYSSGESILDSSNNSSSNHSPIGSSSPVIDIDSIKNPWHSTLQNKTNIDTGGNHERVLFQSYFDAWPKPELLPAGTLFLDSGLDVLNGFGGGNRKDQSDQPVMSPFYFDHQQLPVFTEFGKMSNDVGLGGN